jgi:predicted GNAT family acetyltransferase
MDMQHVRQQYDLLLRREARFSDAERIETADFIGFYNATVKRGGIMHAQLDENNANAVIQDAIRLFRGMEGAVSFEWKYFDYDLPADLSERLSAAGFTPEEREAVLVLELANLPDDLRPPIRHDVRRVTDPQHAADVARAVNRAVYSDDDFEWMAQVIQQRMMHDELSFYAVYVDDQPVSMGWIDFIMVFGGLWGGGTMPEYRNRGIYSALVAARAQEAIARGMHYLYIEASPMSRAVLEKRGFRFMAHTTPYLYQIT